LTLRKLLALSFLAAALGSLLFPQSLVEIAQKERERRAALKGKKAVVITNASLAKLKKKPALDTPLPSPEPSPEESALPEATPSPPAEARDRSASGQMPVENPVPPDLKTLQERWEKAKEYVELLTLKMGTLWQQFSSLEDVTTKDALQQAIAETFVKLEKAQEEEDRARQDLEKFLGQQKKEEPASIWIR
jgi:hypothetical protein